LKFESHELGLLKKKATVVALVHQSRGSLLIGCLTKLKDYLATHLEPHTQTEVLAFAAKAQTQTCQGLERVIFQTFCIKAYNYKSFLDKL
jgi:hypothetical protein